MARKKYHKDSWQWQRIQEILDDYWATEPDEFMVEVILNFRKVNGEMQHKHIHWVNPKYALKRNPEALTEERIKKALPTMAEMDYWLACPHCGERLTDMPWIIRGEPANYGGGISGMWTEHLEAELRDWEKEKKLFEDFEAQYVARGGRKWLDGKNERGEEQ